MAMQTPTEIRRSVLRARLASLDRQVHRLEEELEGHTDRDWSELAQLREGDEVLERQGSAGLAEMAAIRAALRRLDEGAYGVCVRCGDAIAPERLDLLPQTPLCAACAGARAR